MCTAETDNGGDRDGRDNAPADEVWAIHAVNDAGTTEAHEWIIDSGASKYMCHDEQLCLDKLRRSSVPHVTVANKTKAPVYTEGEVLLEVMNTDGNSNSSSSSNLLSMSAIAKKGLKVVFQSDIYEVLSKCNKVVLQGRLSSNNIYKVSLCKPIETNYVQDAAKVKGFKCTCQDHITVWHRRLAHLNPVYLNQLKNDAATGISLIDSNMSHCQTCTMSKLAKQPFRLNRKCASKQLDLVHTDVCQMDVASIGQAKYFVTFLDNYSRKVFVYFIKQKMRCLKYLNAL